MKYVRVLAAAVCVQLVLVYASGMLAQEPATQSAPAAHQDIEVAGGDHGSVISSHQAEIFAFFAKHSK